MKYQHTVVIILPALNEEVTIGKVIDEIPTQELTQKGYDVKVVVADGNSTDKTRQIAEAKGAEIIIEPRKGKGRAMRTAFEQTKADFIFMIDADYTYPTTYIPDMLDILQHNNDVVIGSRLKGERENGAMNRLNVVGNYILTSIANTLYRTKISDLCTGYWGFRGEIVPQLHLSADGFDFEADLFMQLTKNNYHIVEIPIDYRRRPNETKLNSLTDGLKIGWKLITERF